METWVQNYSAVGGSQLLTAAVALLPIVFFFVALTILKMKGYMAGLFTLLIALGVAIVGFGMPAGMAVSSALYGFAYGLWPIAWIIITAVFLYKITVKTGQFDIIRSSVISITEDQRLQMLLVGFSFALLHWYVPVFAAVAGGAIAHLIRSARERRANSARRASGD